MLGGPCNCEELADKFALHKHASGRLVSFGPNLWTHQQTVDRPTEMPRSDRRSAVSW